MELVNATPFPTLLERNALDDGRMEAVCVCAVTYRTKMTRNGPGLAVADDQRPLEARGRERLGDVAWHKKSVSVCATGFVYSHERDRRQGAARLTVGEEKRTVVAFGPRVWQRGLTGRPVPSDPLPFERVAMSWKNAYGGSHEVPTRLIDIEGMEVVVPHHSSTCADNPEGKGHYLDEAGAAESALPELEDPEHPLRRWDDRPQPVCFAPYATHGALRRFFLEQAGVDLGKPLVSFSRITPEALRKVPARPEDYAVLFSKAAPLTTFPEIPAGTQISLTGMRPDHKEIRFAVPEPAIAIQLEVGSARSTPRPLLDAVDIDAEEGSVRFLFRAKFDYPLLAHDRRRVLVTVIDPSIYEENA